MEELIITNYNGILVTDSRDVAEKTGKRHADLLETIRKYVQHLENGKYRSQDFFIESTYKVEDNPKTYECYLLTRKGCDMVANKMTGEKGVLFTAEYVTEFEKMENEIRKPIPKLSKELQAIFMLDEKQQVLEEKVNDLESNMPLFNIECKELQSAVKSIGTKALGGYKSPAYKDNSLRGKVYSDIQHQLKREFDVNRYEAIKHSQFVQAKDIVVNYKLPTALKEKVDLTNNQISMEG